MTSWHIPQLLIRMFSGTNSSPVMFWLDLKNLWLTDPGSGANASPLYGVGKLCFRSPVQPSIEWPRVTPPKGSKPAGDWGGLGEGGGPTHGSASTIHSALELELVGR